MLSQTSCIGATAIDDGRRRCIVLSPLSTLVLQQSGSQVGDILFEQLGKIIAFRVLIFRAPAVHQQVSCLINDLLGTSNVHFCIGLVHRVHEILADLLQFLKFRTPAE